MIELFFQLLILHALCDFALQGEAMAVYKNRHNEPDNPNMPQWYYWLTAHSLIHAGGVYLILGPFYALIELVLHWLIDFAKCEKFTNLHEDQIMHIGAKAVYILVWAGWL